MNKKILLLTMAMCLVLTRLMATVVYVDSSNTAGTQDGTAWGSAFYNFQDGIDAAVAGDTIWVAKGSYQPLPSSSFVLKEGVKIFGGFLNTHTSFAQRSAQSNLTQLKGSNKNVIRNDNNGLTGASVLDGFIITGGTAAVDGGGGMYNNNVSPAIRNCTFLRNMVSGPTVIGGGAMYNYYASPEISNCKFLANSGPMYMPNFNKGNGGAIYNDHSLSEIRDCIFSGNALINDGFPIASGGAIYNDSSNISMINCNFLADTAGSGGAIYNYHSTYLVDNGTFTDNATRGGGLRWGSGGAIFNEQSTGIIKNCSFTNNIANKATVGSALTGKGGAIFNLVSSTTIDSCSFTGNTIGYAGWTQLNSGGGAIYNDSVTAFTIRHSTFSGNKVDGSDAGGGAISNFKGKNILIENCTFTGNISGSGLGGGAICNQVCNPNISNCVFTRNLADNGAGIFNRYAYPVIANDSFIENTAVNGSGGGIYNIGGLDTAINISGCAFIRDSSYVTFSTGGGAGAGIFNYNVNTNITNCLFEANSASSGAGISNGYGKSVIHNCTFANNKVSAFGAGILNSSCTIDVSNCQFLNNQSYSDGAAIYTSNTYASLAFSTIRDNQFTGNEANWIYPGQSGGGGALYIEDSVLVKNCRFAANKGNYGGAISMKRKTNKVVNCVFSKNTARYGGAGIYVYEASPYVTNCTFVGNVVDSLNAAPAFQPGGAGIYSYGRNPTNDSSAHVTNTIIWGNNSGVYANSTAFPTYSYGLIQGLGAFPARHLLAGTTNPLFVDTATGDYNLQSTSPCINKGNSSAVPPGILTDIAGHIRIVDTVDLGAYEYIGVPLAAHLLSFTGRNLANGANLLQWKVAPEHHIVYFELQRGAQGNEFKTLVKQNAGTETEYAWKDLSPLPVSYYRLMMTDADGTTSYSNVIRISTQPEKATAAVYPNPAGETVYIRTGTPQLLFTRATLRDVYGKAVRTQTITQDNQDLSLAGLAPGIYVLTLADGQSFRLVKE